MTTEELWAELEALAAKHNTSAGILLAELNTRDTRRKAAAIERRRERADRLGVDWRYLPDEE